VGLFSKLKAQVEAAQQAGNAMAGAEPANDVPEFIAPRPQEEVDRLLQGSGPIRAIVLGKRHQVLEDGERIGRMRVHVRLRPRGPEGTLGDEVTVKASISTWVASLLEPGLDIPVERDPSTGAITKVDSKLLTEELAPRKDEADRKRPGFAVDPALQGMAETAGAIRDALTGKTTTEQPLPSAGDPRREPVDGITWETYVAVSAHLQVHPAPQGGDDKVAQRYGVRPYTWLAVSSVWKGRLDADPELAQLFERDVTAAKEAL
jgi:hypothetical protein